MRKLFTIVLSLVAFIGISVSTANAKTLKCQTLKRVIEHGLSKFIINLVQNFFGQNQPDMIQSRS